MRCVFFDTECLNSPTDEGFSWNDPWALGLAVAATTEKDQGARQWLQQHAVELVRYFESADAVIGFNCLRFDFPLVDGEANNQTEPDVGYTPSSPTLADWMEAQDVAIVDMLLDVWDSIGGRVKGTGLGPLSIHTLGDPKVMEGALAPVAWADHRILEVVGYCADDVEKSRRLFNHGLQHGWLKRPDDRGEGPPPIQFPITWHVRKPSGEVIEPFVDWHRERAATQQE